MQKTKRILLICSDLETPGGIEKATVNLANLLNEYKLNVSILIISKTSNSFYKINSGVQIENCFLHFGIHNIGNPIKRKVQLIQHILQLRKIFKRSKPQIIISTEYVFTIAAYLAKQSHIVLFSWEHHHFNWLKKNIFWSILQKQIYPKITGIVCLNKKEAELFQAIGCKTFVIPNFCDHQIERSSLESKTLLTIGWLIERKGVDMIPEIAKRVFDNHPDWKWVIVGKGPLEYQLKSKIKRNNLNQFIKIKEPISPDLKNIYKDASIYVMTSRFECFPMVLLEAKAFGIPTISFDCPTGPSDIIKHKIDGLLVELENVEAIVDAIEMLIKNKTHLQEMGLKAYNNSLEFTPQKNIQLWQQLFDIRKLF